MKQYLTAKDLQEIIPTLTYEKSLVIIKKAREIMKEKNYYIPITKTKLALAQIVYELLGIERS